MEDRTVSIVMPERYWDALQKLEGFSFDSIHVLAGREDARLVCRESNGAMSYITREVLTSAPCDKCHGRGRLVPDARS